MPVTPVVLVLQGAASTPAREAAAVGLAAEAAEWLRHEIGAGPRVNAVRVVRSGVTPPADLISLKNTWAYTTIPDTLRGLGMDIDRELFAVWVLGVPCGDGWGLRFDAGGGIAVIGQAALDYRNAFPRAQLWYTLHELGHAGGLPHLGDPLAETYARQSVMVYTSAVPFERGEMQTGLTAGEAATLRGNPLIGESVMRTTYVSESFTFTNPQLAGWPRGKPSRIIVHRQGNAKNPTVHARASLQWGNDTAAYTVHDYIEDGTVIHAVNYDYHAHHVSASTYAAALGWPVNAPNGTKRGDIDAIGIESVDTLIGCAPGQAYCLSQETRITYVIKLAELCKQFGLDPLGRNATGGYVIDEHATYDPANRAEDLGDALNVPDLRLDVADFMAGRTPYRTVGQYARGTRYSGPVPAPVPAPAPAPAPAPVPVNTRPAEVAARAARLRQLADEIEAAG